MNIAEIKARSAVARMTCRPVWFGNDGALRLGHSGDLIEMLENIGCPTIGPAPKKDA